MADITDQQFLSQDPEVLGLQRQRALANLLTGQAFNAPQGQMISGHYVKPSALQQALPMINAAIGGLTNANLDTKQTELAAALRGKKVEEQKAIMDAINSGDTKKALALASQAQYGGKEFVAPLLGNIIPKAPEIMSEKDKEDIRIKDAQNKIAEAHYKQIAAQTAQSIAQGKVPSGYRMTKDGNLEAIPGGPADIKAQTVGVGKQTVNTLVGGLKDEYDKLLSNGGITSTAQPVTSNIPAAIGSSGIGQMTGKLFGTENQSARNTIAQSRPLLLQAIKSATGMSAKQMDSNVELKMYLSAATDPTLDYESNMHALNQLETLYGGAANNKNTEGWRLK